MAAWDVVVLGGGAAGLMCAITAGQRGCRVLVLERANRIGKKILMSGGGRCNFTNLHVTADNFLSANPDFCRSALARYSQWDFLALVDQHLIPWHDKGEGQLFCDHSAKDIVTMLAAECASAGVEIRTGLEASQVLQRDDGCWQLIVAGTTLSCRSLVVATGGLSVPTLGGSGYGYDLAAQLDLPILPRRAGLVPLTFTDGTRELSAELSGVSLPATISTDNQSFSDQMLFTHRGLSGPAVLQISSYWQESQPVAVDLLPNTNPADLLLAAKHEAPNSMVRSCLAKLLPRNLVLALEQRWWSERADTPLQQWPDRDLQALAAQLHHWALRPAGTEGYRTAEVTLGGVDTRELSSRTMACNRYPGLYFIGEVVDVTGHLGGHNFQWAWSSGVAAGTAIGDLRGSG